MTPDSFATRLYPCLFELDSQPVTQTLFHYVIVRNDLPVGMLAAQIVHAAGETSPGNLLSGTHAVVLGIDSEQELKSLSRKLRDANVPHKPIIENDPPYTDQWMAIGISPAPKSAIYPHVKRLNLVRGSAPTSAKKEAPKRLGE